MARPVLIVEDNEYIRRILTHIIQGAGAEVVDADHGEAALSYVQKVEVPVACVLDLMMPRMDGFAFLQHIRSDPKTKELPVIVCTARNDEETFAKLRSLGVTEIIVKPKIDKKTVVTAIRRAVAAARGAKSP